MYIYKAGRFPYAIIQHLVENLDREEVLGLGEVKGIYSMGNEEKPRFNIYSRRDTDEQE